MYQRSLLLFFLIAIICSVIAEINIKKCKPDDDKCQKESTAEFLPTFASGLQEYGIPSLDPLVLKQVDGSIPNFTFKVSDLNVKGLKNCIPKKVQTNTKKSKLFLKLSCTVDIDGHYDMKGKLLLIDLEGNGKLEAKIRQIVIDVDVDIVEKVKDGKKHWSLTTWKHTFQLKEKCEISFDNLFNGNEILAKSVNEVIKTSCNDIVQEIAPGILNEIIKRAIKNINSFFGKKSLDDFIAD